MGYTQVRYPFWKWKMVNGVKQQVFWTALLGEAINAAFRMIEEHTKTNPPTDPQTVAPHQVPQS